MTKSAVFLYVCVSAFVLSCQAGKFEKTDEGVILYPSNNAARAIKIQFVTDDIVHVTASPSMSFSRDTSLIVLKKNADKVDWDFQETDNTLIVQTKKLELTICIQTGEIVFKDRKNNIKLKEIAGGGKTFNTIKIDNEKLYSIRQVFESPDDEAFYGLGQHQERQMNYKGKDVDLIQENMEDVIPFLYSNKNYGLLWDNYSISKFGDLRDFMQLSSLKLFSKNAKEGGLTAGYYLGENLIVSYNTNKIDYQYNDERDSLPKEVRDSSNIKVIWEGYIASDIKGMHKFKLTASSYFKLWIDGKLIVDKWKQNWLAGNTTFKLNMVKDKKYPIKLEWIPNQGYIALKHLEPISRKEQNNLSLSSEVARQIDYYFINGSSADEVISGYRMLTGKSQIMPVWAMGLWQSRERYTTQEEILETVKEFRKRKIPIDNIVLDWRYWEDGKWGTHEFDSARFPNPKKMIEELHNNLHTNIMISVWPKFYDSIQHFYEMKDKEFLYMYSIEKQRQDWMGYVATFYDAFNPEARKLYWKQIKEHLYPLGFDAWWLDATEPDIHSNFSIAERKRMMNPTFLGSGAKFFNAYSLLNSKGIYSNLRETDPKRRVFILTRSSFAGQQHYSTATWSGDVACTWSDLADQIPAGINFCLSGIPYWTHDIGGFSLEDRFYNATGEDLDEWRELNTRWFQFGAFSPLFRVHGQYPYREMFNIAPSDHLAYKSMLYYDKLRYRLMPYIYSLAGWTYFKDYTIMRGLVMDFSFDKKVLNISDQYMFGTALMVCPVTKYKSSERKVYLPSKTGWYNLYSGEFFDGGRTIIAKAPYERIPVFAKEGSILLMGHEIEYSTEKAGNAITLLLYAGKDASFDYYEDEGINYNYEKGEYSIIPIRYNDVNNTLIIETRQGKFPGMSQDKVFTIVFVSKESPAGIDDKNVKSEKVQYSGKKLVIKLK